MKIKSSLSALSMLSLILAATSGARAETQAIDPLTVTTLNGRSLLADAEGKILYTFDPDQIGKSNCNGPCARVWPPLSLPAQDVLQAPLSRIVRSDGSSQIAYDGHPLYYYVGDSGPGQDNGDGLQGIWHVVSPQ